MEREKIARLKLTTCQTIQLHDLTAGQVPVIMEDAMESGIITKGGGGDNPRNVMASVTTLATGAGAMSTDIASLLIAAGGISVLIMPLGASVTFKAMEVASASARKGAK